MVKEQMKKNGMEKLFDEYMKRIQDGDTKAMNEIGLIFQNNYNKKFLSQHQIMRFQKRTWIRGQFF